MAGSLAQPPVPVAGGGGPCLELPARHVLCRGPAAFRLSCLQPMTGAHCCMHSLHCEVYSVVLSAPAAAALGLLVSVAAEASARNVDPVLKGWDNNESVAAAGGGCLPGHSLLGRLPPAAVMLPLLCITVQVLRGGLGRVVQVQVITRETRAASDLQHQTGQRCHRTCKNSHLHIMLETLQILQRGHSATGCTCAAASGKTWPAADRQHPLAVGVGVRAWPTQLQQNTSRHTRRRIHGIHQVLLAGLPLDRGKKGMAERPNAAMLLCVSKLKAKAACPLLHDTQGPLAWVAQPNQGACRRRHTPPPQQGGCHNNAHSYASGGYQTRIGSYITGAKVILTPGWLSGLRLLLAAATRTHVIGAHKTFPQHAHTLHSSHRGRCNTPDCCRIELQRYDEEAPHGIPCTHRLSAQSQAGRVGRHTHLQQWSTQPTSTKYASVRATSVCAALREMTECCHSTTQVGGPCRGETMPSHATDNTGSRVFERTHRDSHAPQQHSRC